jgi:hypothetical protein
MLLWAVKFAPQPHPPRKLTPLFSADPRLSRFSRKCALVSSLESALTDTPSLSSLESALTKNTGGIPTLFVYSLFPSGNSVGDCGALAAMASSSG